MDCLHISRIWDEDSSSLVCTDCGTVLDDAMLVSTGVTQVDGGEPHTQTAVNFQPPLIAIKIHQKTHSQKGKERLEGLLHEISLHFGWSGASEQIVSMFLELAERGSTDYGKGGERMIAALYLLFARKHGLPITLRQMADYLDDSIVEIGRLVYIILSAYRYLDFSANGDRFLARHMAFFDLTDVRLAKKVKNMFNILMGYVRSIGLNEGRHPEPLSLSCLVICLQSLDSFSFTLEQSCARLGLSYDTTHKRYKEVKRHLLERATEVLPWGADVRYSNVLQHLPQLLQVLNTPQFNPPSYRRSIMNSEERRLLVERVKRGDNVNSVESFVIEYLLDAGWEEQDIIATSNLTIDLL